MSRPAKLETRTWQGERWATSLHPDEDAGAWAGFTVVLIGLSLPEIFRARDDTADRAWLSRVWLQSEDDAFAALKVQVRHQELRCWLEWEADPSLEDAEGGTLSVKGLEDQQGPFSAKVHSLLRRANRLLRLYWKAEGRPQGSTVLRPQDFARVLEVALALPSRRPKDQPGMDGSRGRRRHVHLQVVPRPLPPRPTGCIGRPCGLAPRARAVASSVPRH